jgi:hypothetical protein
MNKTLFFFLGFFTISLWALAADSVRPRLGYRDVPVIRAPVSHIYAPQGFDDNDVAQISIEGSFPDDCYQVERVIPTYDIPRKKIQIDVIAVRKAIDCRKGKSSYLKNIDLKILPSGRYEIQAGSSLEGQRAQTAVLEIKRAPSKKRDDFLYAPVNSFVIKTDGNGKRSIVVLGYFSKPCYQFDIFNTKAVRPNGSDTSVLVVLPVLNETMDSNCAEAPTPFSHKIEIPDFVPNGKYLIHIRIPEGSFSQIGYIGLRNPEE